MNSSLIGTLAEIRYLLLSIVGLSMLSSFSVADERERYEELVKVIHYFLNRGELDRAEAAVHSFEAQPTSHSKADAWAHFAFFLIKRGENDRAARAYEAALDLSSKQSELHGKRRAIDPYFEANAYSSLTKLYFEQGKLGLASIRQQESEASLLELVSLVTGQSGATFEDLSSFRELSQERMGLALDIALFSTRFQIFSGRTGAALEALRRLSAFLALPENASPMSVIYRVQAMTEESKLLRLLGRFSEADARAQEMVSFIRPFQQHLPAPIGVLPDAFDKVGEKAPVSDHVKLSENVVAEMEKQMRETSDEDIHARGITANLISSLLVEKGKLASFYYLAGRREESEALFQQITRDSEARGMTSILVKILSRRLQLRTNAGQLEGLEPDYIRLLSRIRDLGNKLEELQAYESFANWLRQAGRPAEALKILSQIQLLNERFGRFAAVLLTKAKMASLYIILDNVDEAIRLWHQIDRRLEERKLPDPRMVIYLNRFRIEFLKSQGKHSKAQELHVQTLELAKRTGLSEEELAQIATFDPQTASELGVAVPSEDPDFDTDSVDIQPLEFATYIRDGEIARARFTLSNSTHESHQGRMTVSRSPATEEWDAEAGILKLELAKGRATSGTFEKDLSLLPGDQVIVILEVDTADGDEEATVTVSWFETATSSSKWHYESGSDESDVAVVNASTIRRNPFYIVPLYHELYYRGVGESIANVRVLCDQPIRVEFVDDDSGRLIAVDGNGNGSFSDVGDAVYEDRDNNGYPDFMLSPEESVAAFELLVYHNERAGEYTGTLPLSIQVKNDDTWETHAIDQLIFD